MNRDETDFERLLALTSGEIVCMDDDDANRLIAEEERLTDALVHSHGGLDQAALKLRILAARLRSDGHGDCAEGQRNLALLESTVTDLRLALS